MKFKKSTSSDRFFQIRNARNTEIAEDYTEMIAELINENGEARVVDLESMWLVLFVLVVVSVVVVDVAGVRWCGWWLVHFRVLDLLRVFVWGLNARFFGYWICCGWPVWG